MRYLYASNAHIKLRLVSFSTLFAIFSKTINKWRETLRSPNPVLEKEPEPLNSCSISHELTKLCRIRSNLIHNLFIPSRSWKVLSYTPGASNILVLVAQNPAVKELGSFRMGGILEDRTGLGPAYKFALFWVGDTQRREGSEADK